MFVLTGNQQAAGSNVFKVAPQYSMHGAQINRCVGSRHVPRGSRRIDGTSPFLFGGGSGRYRCSAAGRGRAAAAAAAAAAAGGSHGHSPFSSPGSGCVGFVGGGLDFFVVGWHHRWFGGTFAAAGSSGTFVGNGVRGCCGHRIGRRGGSSSTA